MFQTIKSLIIRRQDTSFDKLIQRLTVKKKVLASLHSQSFSDLIDNGGSLTQGAKFEFGANACDRGRTINATNSTVFN